MSDKSFEQNDSGVDTTAVSGGLDVSKIDL